MSRLIAVRMEEDALERVDEERRRSGLTRAAAIKEALALWVERRRHDDAVRRDQEGYARHPITEDEFGPILRAQVWPK